MKIRVWTSNVEFVLIIPDLTSDEEPRERLMKSASFLTAGSYLMFTRGSVQHIRVWRAFLV